MKRRRGLSMIEVLIALVVMSIAILAVIGAFPTVFKTDRRTMFSSIALYDAQTALDTVLRANVFVSTTPVVTTPFSNPTPGAVGLPNGFQSVVGSADPGGNANFQQVSVTETWVENGRVRSITLVSEVEP